MRSARRVRVARQGTGLVAGLAVATVVVVLGVGHLASARGARAQRFETPRGAGRPPFGCPLAPAPAGPPDGTTPSRLDVIVAMGPVNPQVVACAPWTHGEVQWRMTFRGFDGAPVEVQLVSASTPPPTDAELRCMEVAACGARVPAFTRDTFVVSYPFRY